MTIEVSGSQLAALVRGDAITIGPTKRVITLDDGPFVVQRHHGPGPHPGTGTSQDVHGKGGKAETSTSFDPSMIEGGQGTPGFCFSDSAEWFLYGQGKQFPQARLVHGTVMGQGPIEGKRFVHGWVEIEDWVYDPSQDLIAHKKQYYDLAQAENMVSYTDTEAMINMARQKHWGPWDTYLLEFREKELKEWFR